MRRRDLFVVLCPAAAGRAQSTSTETDSEERWRQYLEWSTERRRSEPVMEYRDRLMSEGVPIDQVDERIQELRNRMLYQPKTREAWYDRAYEKSREEHSENRSTPTESTLFETNRNEFLAEVVKGLPPGEALDVAMGQGRNAVFLARRGWRVTGFDVSDVGLAVAQANARRAGVRLKTVTASTGSFGYGRERYDLIMMLYAFVPLSARLAKRLTDSLKPGGLLVYENLLEVPKNEDMKLLGAMGLPAPDSLPRAFPGLEVERNEQMLKLPDWGSLQPRPLVRFVARKPK